MLWFEGPGQVDQKQATPVITDEAERSNVYHRRFNKLVDAMGGDFTSSWSEPKESEPSVAPVEVANNSVQMQDSQRNNRHTASPPSHGTPQGRHGQQFEVCETSDNRKAPDSCQGMAATVLLAVFLMYLTWWYSSYS
jgi:hypothetical protein